MAPRRSRRAPYWSRPPAGQGRVSSRSPGIWSWKRCSLRFAGGMPLPKRCWPWSANCSRRGATRRGMTPSASSRPFPGAASLRGAGRILPRSLNGAATGPGTGCLAGRGDRQAQRRGGAGAGAEHVLPRSGAGGASQQSSVSPRRPSVTWSGCGHTARAFRPGCSGASTTPSARVQRRRDQTGRNDAGANRKSCRGN